MTLQRAAISLGLGACAVVSLLCARSAAAGKMIFLAGRVEQVFQLDTWFSPQSGILTLDPSGCRGEEVRVEILASAGRSPASSDIASTVVLKRMTISRPTQVNLAELSRESDSGSGVIRIRVLAP